MGEITTEELKKYFPTMRCVKRGREPLYTIVVNRKFLEEKVEHGVPSGGFNKEFCLNSQLFKKRICKQDGKEYQAGERCSCFT